MWMRREKRKRTKLKNGFTSTLVLMISIFQPVMYVDSVQEQQSLNSFLSKDGLRLSVFNSFTVVIINNFIMLM